MADIEVKYLQDTKAGDRHPSIRVSLGAQLLDRKRPEWAEQINIHDLDMWSDSDCVLGQVYGMAAKMCEECSGWLSGYAHGLHTLELVRKDGSTSAELYGFAPVVREDELTDGKLLHEAWIRVITGQLLPSYNDRKVDRQVVAW